MTMAFLTVLIFILKVIWRTTFVFQMGTIFFDLGLGKSGKFYFQMTYHVRDQGRLQKSFCESEIKNCGLHLKRKFFF